MAPIHDRMPVVLDESQPDAWMDPTGTGTVLRSMLWPLPVDRLVPEKASPLVNNVRKDGSEPLDALLD
jgi:putative SOS response-associated peptidase YedK